MCYPDNLMFMLLFNFSCRWFSAWQRYTGQRDDAPFEDYSIESQTLASSDSDGRPGVIDNSDIIVNGEDKDDDPQLLRTLVEGSDYVLVPQEVWEKLTKWYLFLLFLELHIFHVSTKLPVLYRLNFLEAEL